MLPDVYSDLKQRELVYQESHPEELPTLLRREAIVLYAGFDPTADSLHIGNLVPLIALRRFQLAGHHPIAVLGGGTGLIGDPSGKADERTLNTKDTVDQWVANIQPQIARFLDFESGANPARIVDNYTWIAPTSVIDFLRDIGKHFSVNSMLAKDSVRSRLDSPDGSEGISFTEFSYMVLQAYDFTHLAATYDCKLQIGGSDQWGNITAGIDLIRRRLGRPSYGLTFPLITTATGEKFGKTAGGAVWLDPKRTSPFAFYQYWINVDDRDVIRYLRLFTFLEASEIQRLAAQVISAPERREAQVVLAREMTGMVHGAEACDRVREATEALFGSRNLRDVDPITLSSALNSAPAIQVSKPGEKPIAHLLVDSGLAASRSAARQLIQGGGVYLNDLRVGDVEYVPTTNDLIQSRFFVLRRGKKQYAVIRVSSPS